MPSIAIVPTEWSARSRPGELRSEQRPDTSQIRTSPFPECDRGAGTTHATSAFGPTAVGTTLDLGQREGSAPRARRRHERLEDKDRRRAFGGRTTVRGVPHLAEIDLQLTAAIELEALGSKSVPRVESAGVPHAQIRDIHERRCTSARSTDGYGKRPGTGYDTSDNYSGVDRESHKRFTSALPARRAQATNVAHRLPSLSAAPCCSGAQSTT
jgi:hypothetical protein